MEKANEQVLAFFNLEIEYKPTVNTYLEKGKSSKSLFVARPNSGKSYMIKYLMYQLRQFFPLIKVFSHSNSFSNDYDYVPDILISGNIDQEKLLDVIQRQKYATKYLENPNLALILDDVADDKKLWNTKVVRSLLFNGRHFFLNLFVTTQYAKSIAVDIRNTFDYIFIFNDANQDNRKKNYETFCRIIPTFELFNSLFDNMPEFGVLVIINGKVTNNWLDSVRWFKAGQVPDDWLSCTSLTWIQNDERKKNVESDDELF